MKILICDDEASYGKWLGQQISAYEDAHREPCEVVVSCDCRKLYEEIEKYRGFDVAFFDIEMPGVCHSSSKEEQRAPSTSGGFMLAEKCRWLCPGMRIVFVSSHEELVFSSFAYRPFYFLRKSKEAEELPEILDRICTDIRQQKGAYLTLKTENEYVRIYFREIYYMESERNRLHIHTAAREYLCYKSMKALQEQLPEREFLKCHGSFLVNVYCIKEVREKDLLLLNGEPIPVSRMYRKELLAGMRRGAFM